MGGWGAAGEPTPRIEDHALIGDMRTAALVTKDGSIDWLCLPAFDSDACFAALLGTADNGRWRIAPTVPVKVVRRRYRKDTLILETDFVTETGTVRLVDFMPPRRGREYSQVCRFLRCLEGTRADALRGFAALRVRASRAPCRPGGRRDEDVRRPRRAVPARRAHRGISLARRRVSSLPGRRGLVLAQLRALVRRAASARMTSPRPSATRRSSGPAGVRPFACLRSTGTW